MMIPWWRRGIGILLGSLTEAPEYNCGGVAI